MCHNYMKCSGLNYIFILYILIVIIQNVILYNLLRTGTFIVFIVSAFHACTKGKQKWEQYVLKWYRFYYNILLHTIMYIFLRK